MSCGQLRLKKEVLGVRWSVTSKDRSIEVCCDQCQLKACVCGDSYLATGAAVVSAEGDSELSCTQHTHGDPCIRDPHWGTTPQLEVCIHLKLKTKTQVISHGTSYLTQ